MDITLTPEQEEILAEIIDWYEHSPGQYITLGGYAGTGKTTLLKFLNEELRAENPYFVSLAGKAVNVLKNKIPGAITSTIHKLMYRPIVDRRGQISGWVRNQRKDFPVKSLLVNDEASMTDKDLFSDLLSYDKKILFVGDHGQLPPVKSTFNLMDNPDLKLTKILRQAEESPILNLATQARTTGKVKLGAYSDTVQVGSLEDLPPRTKEAFFSGDDDTIIITATNANRVMLNKVIRAALGRKHRDPVVGDKLVVLKNDYEVGVYNGEIIEIVEITKKLKDKMYISASIDGQVMNDICISTLCLDEPSPYIKYVRNNSPLHVDYGYALTCHKSQGSEFKRVFVHGRGFGTLDEKKRWLYTAITRAQEELYVV